MLAILLILLVVATAFAVAGLSGAPYVPILSRDTETLLDMAEIKPGQTIIDLGSGDGYLLRAAAKRGIKGIGYEINPFMVLIAKIACFRYRRLITIHLANLWKVQLPKADAVYIFLMPRSLDRLDQKLGSELSSPTIVISYAFEIPHQIALKKTKNTFIYKYNPAKHSG